MKKYFSILLFLMTSLLFCQERTTIKVIVPDPDDEVYIVGNQRDLGDWNPSKIKMYKVSDYVRMISIPFYFPAEFMFTKGSLASEGIIFELDDNPNIVIEEYVDEKVYKIKGWKNEMLKAKFTTPYKNEPFESEVFKDNRKLKVYTPQNYSITNRYPVIYVPDVGDIFQNAANYLDIWSGEDYKTFPDCILIGIPFKSKELWTIKNELNNTEQLMKYITFDVVPFVNSKFSTSGFNAIASETFMADFVNKLILKGNSPFKACINISPNNEVDLSYTLDNFLKNNDEEKIYYFLALPEFVTNLDPKSQLKIKSLFTEDTSADTFKYNTSEENIFTTSFLDAMKFIFKDFRNFKTYSNFDEFVYNYESDVRNIYGISSIYHQNDVFYFLNDILNKKDEISYNNLINFIELKQIKDENGNQLKFSDIEKAIHYFELSKYEACIEIFEREFKQFETEKIDKAKAREFFNHIEYLLISYAELEKEKKIYEILEKVIEYLPSYILESYYLMAKYSSKYDVLVTRGKTALEYCQNYYHENEVFTKKDLSKISFE